MKILLLILLLIFSINTTNAQLQGQALIDSLLKELPKMKEDTNGVNLLVNISSAFSHIDPNKGIEYAKKGVEYSKEIKWKKGEANSLKELGYTYFYLFSDVPLGLDMFEKALKIYEKIDDKAGASRCIANIGTIYHFQNDFTLALEYYEKARVLFINAGLTNLSAGITHNIGFIYENLQKYELALEYYQKAREINQSDGGNKIWLSTNLAGIAEIYLKQSSYQKSLEYYNLALEINYEIEDILGQGYILGQLGELYLKISKDSVLDIINKESISISHDRKINLQKSIKFSLQAINILNELGEILERFSFLYNLSQAYEHSGDSVKAYIAFKEFKLLQDSVFNQENNEKLSKLKKAREEDIKQLKIESQEKEKQLIIISAIGALLSVLIILTVIIIQRRKSEKLLLNVLPAKIAKRLKAKEHPIADHFDGASIIFIDLVGFTKMSSSANPKEIVALLNDIFTLFDKLADKHGLEKIKTIGDAYMAVAGIPEIQADHSKRTAQMALDIKSEMKDFKTSDGTEIKFRIGIDCGAVVAGVIGEKKFIYDLWSDAVNTASRMESTGESGQIQITDNFKTELEKFEGNWNFTLRGEFEIKGKGLMKTYYLD